MKIKKDHKFKKFTILFLLIISLLDVFGLIPLYSYVMKVNMETCETKEESYIIGLKVRNTTSENYFSQLLSSNKDGSWQTVIIRKGLIRKKRLNIEKGDILAQLNFLEIYWNEKKTNNVNQQQQLIQLMKYWNSSDQFDNSWVYLNQFKINELDSTRVKAINR